MDNIDPPFIDKGDRKKSEQRRQQQQQQSPPTAAAIRAATKNEKVDYTIDNNDYYNDSKEGSTRPFHVGGRDLNPLSSSSKNGGDIESGGMIVGPDHPGFFPSPTFTSSRSHTGRRDDKDESGGRLKSLVPPGARYDPIAPIYPGEPDGDELLPPRGAGYPSSDDGPASSPFAIRPQRLPGSIKDPSNKPPFFHGPYNGPNPFDNDGNGGNDNDSSSNIKRGEGRTGIGRGGIGDTPPFFK